VGDTVQRKWSRVEYEALRRPMYREAEDMSAVVDKWPKATATFALVARQSGQVFEAELYQEAASTGAPVANFDYVRDATFRFDQLVKHAIKTHPWPVSSSRSVPSPWDKGKWSAKQRSRRGGSRHKTRAKQESESDTLSPIYTHPLAGAWILDTPHRYMPSDNRSESGSWTNDSQAKVTRIGSSTRRARESYQKGATLIAAIMIRQPAQTNQEAIHPQIMTHRLMVHRLMVHRLMVHRLMVHRLMVHRLASGTALQQSRSVNEAARGRRWQHPP
jgi:hypothetical protein